MTLTEDDLRAVLRSRTQAAPAVPGLAERAEQDGRRRQARVRAGGAAALVTAVGLLGGAWWPGPDAAVAPPSGITASPAPARIPQLTTTATVAGLDARVTGPASLDSRTGASVTLEVTNTGSGTWRGTLAAGAVQRVADPECVLSPVLLLDDDPEHSYDSGWENRVVASAGGWRFHGVQVAAGGSSTVTLAPGRTRTWTVPVISRRGTVQLTGWSVYVQRAGSRAGEESPRPPRPLTVVPPPAGACSAGP